MSFASIEFFLFLPVVFLIYYLGREKGWQNAVLVVASYVFYAWWDYRFCLLMLVSSLVDFGAGSAMARSDNPRRRKTLLIMSLAANLGLLGFFKYFNFFVDSLVIGLAGLGLNWNTLTLQIILPIGISFYTFQTMSYTIDIYRGRFQPQRNLVDYLAFVSFFPQLVAGPIERAGHLLPQFASARSFSHSEAVEGCRLILWGLVKKMVLADNLAAVVEQAYASPETASGASLAVATFSFAFQIYCDFSAYSDIAAGVAALFGIRLTRNFAYPYFAQRLSEFWRRWHISLSTWFRDYVYIPLGGSHSTSARTARNLFLTFVLSGLWHGAALKFVLWGALHGLALITERALGQGEKPQPKTEAGLNAISRSLGVPFRILRTFLLVCIAWVLFRADTLGEALLIYQKIIVQMSSLNFYPDVLRVLKTHQVIFLLLAVFAIVEWINRDRWNPLLILSRSTAARWGAYTALFWAILYFGTQRTQEFIYFQF